MKTIFLILLLAIVSSHSYGQEIVQEDSHPRYLMKPDPNRFLTAQYYGYAFLPNYLNWENRSPTSDLDRFDAIYKHQETYLIWGTLPLGICYAWSTQSLCGEQFYDNGNIKSRCACTKDSVLHGKYTIWDNAGYISTVSYYYNGVITSSKSFNKGTLVNSNKYTSGQKQGVQVEYRGSTRIDSYYVKNKKHGSEKEYRGDTLVRNSIFEQDLELAQCIFNTEGDTISARYYRDAQNNSQRIPINTWTEYNQYDSTTSYVDYTDGIAKEIHTYEKGYLREHHYKQEDGVIAHFFFNSKRDTTSKFFTKRYQFYSEPQPYSYEYSMPTFGPNYIRKQFVGSGYISSDSCTITYDATQSKREHPYLICHKVKGKDTLEMFYALNDGSYFHSIIHSNKFEYSNGQYRRYGEWRLFDNNKIVSVQNYAMGELDSSHLFFDTTGVESTLLKAGTYKNGLKHGTWSSKDGDAHMNQEFQKDECTQLHRFIYSADTSYKQAGLVDLYPQNNRTIVATSRSIVNYHFKNDSLAHIETFWENGARHWRGGFVNEKPNGMWQEFNFNGNLLKEGLFDDGLPPKKWTVRTQKSNDEFSYRKKKIVVILPNFNPEQPDRIESDDAEKSEIIP